MNITKNSSGPAASVIVCYNKDTDGVDAVYGPFASNAEVKKNKAKIAAKLVEDLETGDEKTLKELYDIWVIPLDKMDI